MFAQKMADQQYYKKGHDSAVSKSHAWRTPETCSAYAIPHIKPTFKILDVGCGPGSISCGLAKYVPHGSVLGIEPTPELVDMAKKHRDELGVHNADFELASAYKLPYADDTFDLVHCHQVLIHLADPELALKEMRRVVKHTGYVCCRDADLASTIVYPEKHELLREYFLSITQDGSSPVRGRSLRELALRAGFHPKHVQSSASTWCMGNEDDRAWFGDMYLHRVMNSKEVLDKNDPSEDAAKRKKFADAWSAYIKDPSACLIMIHGEIVCQKEL